MAFTDLRLIIARNRAGHMITPTHRTPVITCCLLVFTLLAGATDSHGADADPAMVAPVVKTSPDRRYAEDRRAFQGIPTIERTTNGRLWAAWMARSERQRAPDSHIVVVMSDDAGDIWSAPRIVIDPPGTVCAFDPCLWLDHDGLFWLFWAQSDGLWDGRGGVWCITSEDSQSDAPTWSEPRRICDGVMLNKPAVLKTGKSLFPVSVWGKPAGSSTPSKHRQDLGEQSGANVFSLSYTAYEQLTMIGQVRVPQREYDEHHIIERKDDSLWMLVRAPYGIAESESTDGGTTWSEPRRSPIPHINARFCIRRLQSGRLLLVTHEPPDGKARSHLIARLSDDDGKTWKGGLMLDDRAGVSYPDAIEGPKGIIRVIYDFKRTHARQILLARFTEKNVLSAKPARNTALRMIVSQTGDETASR